MADVARFPRSRRRNFTALLEKEDAVSLGHPLCRLHQLLIAALSRRPPQEKPPLLVLLMKQRILQQTSALRRIRRSSEGF